MPTDLSDTLVVGIAATALFDLREADAFFQARMASEPATALQAYRQHMQEREQEPLADGTGMALVRALLGLNRFQSADDSRALVEVVVLSRNSPETGLRVLHAIRRRQLPILRHAFTGGESVVDYLDAFAVDLFLTTNPGDAQRVIDSGQCAAALLKPPPQQGQPPPEDQVRIAFDGDAVLFADTSEVVYKQQGLESFQEQEDASRDQPMADGPYAQFLRKLARLQERLPFGVEESPVRLAIVTARSAPAELRVIHTLRHWGVTVNEIFFLGGIAKTRILQTFRPHIFFDDQEAHLESAAGSVPAGKVPYRSDSPLHPIASRGLNPPETNQGESD
jgi:5'-nucleotidase